MQLTPRYGDDPIIRVEGFDADPLDVFLRGRHRFADLLETLDAEQWASPSRCEGWSVQDVITHLVSTNQFWGFSLASGLAGKPTRYLANFDPVATPADLVAAAESVAPAATLEAFRSSTEAVAAACGDLGGRAWTALVEGPPGHIPAGCLLLHGVWDGLVHERDVALPLGLAAGGDDDELAAALIYAAGLNVGFQLTVGTGRTGTMVVRTTDPTVPFTVELADSLVVRVGQAAVDAAPADAFVLAGDTEATTAFLSCRAPLPPTVADADRWWFSGLATVFDQTPA